MGRGETSGHGTAEIDGRYWPTDAQRPGETVIEWCRRLDSYANAPQTR